MAREWRNVPLRDLSNGERGITYGIVQPGSHTEDGVPILRADDVDNGHINTAGLLKVSREIEAAYVRSRLRGGEVLLTLVGAYFGKVAVAQSVHAGLNTARAVAVIPVVEDPDFVAYALRAPACQQYMQSHATRTAQPTLNLGDVAEIPIPWPEPSIRKAITSILRSIDDKIALLRQMSRTLEETCQALFRSWFAADCGDATTVQNLIDMNILYVGDGYRAKLSEMAEKGLPFARAGNLDNGFSFVGADLLGESGVRSAGNKVSEPWDVVFTSKGTVGRFAIVYPTTQRFVYSPQLCFWRSLDRTRLSPLFLLYWMRNPAFLNQIAAVSGQTDMALYVNLRDQRRMLIREPDFYP